MTPASPDPAPSPTSLRVVGSSPPEPPKLRFTPSTRVMWRTAQSVQLELGDRAVVVNGADHDLVAKLSRDGAPLTSDAFGLLESLAQVGFLSNAAAYSPAAVPATRANGRLAPDRAALAARFGDDAPAVLSARGTRHVAVHGGGRLPALVGSLLAAAGVGAVQVSDSGETGLRDVVPGGLVTDDEGTRKSVAASAAIHRVAPEVDTSGAGAASVDLVILTTGAPVPRPLSASFAHAGQPHLATGVWGSAAVVGPLVIPGRTSCLQCADLQRRDRDSAWPALAAQLATIVETARAPSEVGVVAFAAAVTSMQALQFLDGEQPATVEGTLEFRLPDWRLRRRSWPIHPDCSCAVSIAS